MPPLGGSYSPGGVILWEQLLLGVYLGVFGCFLLATSALMFFTAWDGIDGAACSRPASADVGVLAVLRVFLFSVLVFGTHPEGQ